MTRSIVLLPVLLLAAPLAAQDRFPTPGKDLLPVFDSGWATAFAAGDFDGDGAVDLLLGRNDRSVLVLGRGDGSFVQASAGAWPGNPAEAFALADVDGDGDLDVLLTGASTGSALLRNDGRGRFTVAAASPLSSGALRAEDVAFVDLDGDGDPDAVLAGEVWGVRVFENDGTGGFVDAGPRWLGPGFLRAARIRSADLEGDGDVDLLLTMGGRGQPPRASFLLLLRNDGSGRLALEIGRVPLVALEDCEVGDFDRDGDPDLAVAIFGGASEVWLNDGRGDFSAPQRVPLGPGTAKAIVAADVDLDGDLDLVYAAQAIAAGTPSPSQVFLNQGNGTFVARAAAVPEGIVWPLRSLARDLDADGDPDLLFANRYGEAWLLENDGSGRFERVQGVRPPLPSIPTSDVVSGDLDGDGDLDLLVARNLASPALFFNQGVDWEFVERAYGFMPQLPITTSDQALFDADADGDLDLFLATRGVAEADRLFLNDGTGRFTDASAVGLPASAATSSTAVAAADLDGDGDPDLVVGAGDRTRIYLNDGAGRFVDAPASGVDSVPSVDLTVADLDGDGDLDLALGHRTALGVFLNDGRAGFRSVPAGSLPLLAGEITSLAAGDVDGDGDVDLYLGCSTALVGQPDRLYLNDGTARFVDVGSTRLPQENVSTQAVTLADLDDDSDLDALVVGREARVYWNDGSGRFVRGAQTLESRTSSDLATAHAADLDGDHDLDLLVESRLFVNAQRQLRSPTRVRAGRPYRLEVRGFAGPLGAPQWATVGISPFRRQVPLQLPPLGRFFLDPGLMLVLPPVSLPGTGAPVELGFLLPNDARIEGVDLHVQALFEQPEQAVGLRLSGLVSDTIGR